MVMLIQKAILVMVSISKINDDGCIAMLIFVSGMFVMMFNCKDNLR
jgi:hypothetical protein